MDAKINLFEEFQIDLFTAGRSRRCINQAIALLLCKQIRIFQISLIIFNSIIYCTMKTILIRQRLFTTAKKSEIQPQSTTIKRLAKTFSKHFVQQHQNYEIPLLSKEGLLSYTSRYAQTVLNTKDFTKEDKQNYFSLIKRSIITNKQFTPQSCTDLCESMIDFTFSGDQNPALEKMRKYVKENHLVFTGKEIDRFSIAHKYIMAQKANGPVKFVDLSLPKLTEKNDQTLQQLNVLFKGHGISQLKILWEPKREINFECIIEGSKRMIRLFCLNQQQLKQDDIEVLTKKMEEVVKKGGFVAVIDRQREATKISQIQLSDHLLINSPYYHRVDQYEGSSTTFHGKLIKNILSQSKHSAENILSISISEISRLNFLLINQSLFNLQQLFGYIKFNIFHIEYIKLLNELYKTNTKTITSLPNLDYIRCFTKQQQKIYNMNPTQQIQAKAMIDAFLQRNIKSAHIYVSQKSVVDFLHYFLKYSSVKEEMNKITWKQNQDTQILINKMSLLSVIHGINIDLPTLDKSITQFRSHLHPLTAHLRFK